MTATTRRLAKKVLVEDKDIVQLDICNRVTTVSQMFRFYSGRQSQLIRVEGFRKTAVSIPTLSCSTRAFTPLLLP